MEYIFQDKKIPWTLSKETRNLIETIGETKNKELEEELILKEIQAVRTHISGPIDLDDYPDVLVKLIYFETLGYDTSFAHILPINLCQSQDLYLKKMAYLLAALLVKPGEDMGLLMSNTIIKDLQSENLFVIMIVLTMLRYFLSSDLIALIAPFLRKLSKHQAGIIRKKTFLVYLDVYQNYPLALPEIKQLALEACSDTDPPVLFAGVAIFNRIVRSSPEDFKDVVKRLVEILQNILDHKYPKEYDYHRIPTPWHQIQLLQLLELLGKNDQAASALIY